MNYLSDQVPRATGLRVFDKLYLEDDERIFFVGWIRFFSAGEARKRITASIRLTDGTTLHVGELADQDCLAKLLKAFIIKLFEKIRHKCHPFFVENQPQQRIDLLVPAAAS
jgi:hypothetical protein